MEYSVLTVCLNSSSSIDRSIKSVLLQSKLPKEYIFVDGGSTDGTIEIIENLIENERRTGSKIEFLLLHQASKGGITEAWNIGIKHVNTDVLFILNSDDWYDQTTAETVLSTFDTNKNVEIVHGSSRVYSKDSSEVLKIRGPRPLCLLPILMPVVHTACFVKKSVYDRIGLFDDSYKICADYDFISRCFYNNVIFKRISVILANFQLGGYGDTNRTISRYETCEIAKKYHRSRFLPSLAFSLRRLLNR